MSQDEFIRTALRVPPDLHKALHEAADKNARSFNAEILGRLQQSFVGPSLAGLTEVAHSFGLSIAAERVKVAALSAFLRTTLADSRALSEDERKLAESYLAAVDQPGSGKLGEFLVQLFTMEGNTGDAGFLRHAADNIYNPANEDKVLGQFHQGSTKAAKQVTLRRKPR